MEEAKFKGPKVEFLAHECANEKFFKVTFHIDAGWSLSHGEEGQEYCFIEYCPFCGIDLADLLAAHKLVLRSKNKKKKGE